MRLRTGRMGLKKKERNLNWIKFIGPTELYDDTFIYNDYKAWATWDHYLIHARICEDLFEEKVEKELVWLEAESGGGEEEI